MVEYIDRANAAVAEGFEEHSVTALEKLWSFMGEAIIARRFAIAGPVQAVVDGKGRTLSGFVVERIAVPRNPEDGYSCPRFYRVLVASDGAREGIVVGGTTFDRPIALAPSCRDSLSGMSVMGPTPAAMIITAPAPRGPWLVAHAGRADIAALSGKAEPCTMLGTSDPFVHMRDETTAIECEVMQYRVEVDAQKIAPLDDSPRPLGWREHRLLVTPQIVRGMRLRIHCGASTRDIPGCVRSAPAGDAGKGGEE
jgi:hypothetical protein